MQTHLQVKNTHFAVCSGGAHTALFLRAVYTVRRRWFRDTAVALPFSTEALLPL